MSRAIIIAVIGILLVIHHNSYTQPKKNKEVVRFFMEEILGKGRHELYKDVHTPDFDVNTENETDPETRLSGCSRQSKIFKR